LGPFTAFLYDNFPHSVEIVVSNEKDIKKKKRVPWIKTITKMKELVEVGRE